MTAIRRLAAILAADVAGYSRLMGVDEEGTLERLKALRRQLVDPKIAEHHGRIVKTTGDGVRDRLPFAFEDLGEQQVKNIARLVRIYRVHDIGVAKSRSAPALPLPDKPSIAVLPFANMSGIGPVPSMNSQCEI
jgi:class 3 adenylate cyclase